MYISVEHALMVCKAHTVHVHILRMRMKESKAHKSIYILVNIPSYKILNYENSSIYFIMKLTFFKMNMPNVITI